MSSLDRSQSWTALALDALNWLRPLAWGAIALVIWFAVVTPALADPFPWPPPNTGCPPNTSCIPGGPPGGGNPGQCTANPNGNPGCGGAGNPVDIITGNKYQHEIDLAPLPGEIGLHFSRHYNSNSTHRGLTGVGWRSSFEVVLVDLGSAVQIIDADGRRLTFDRQTKLPGLCVGATPEDGRVLVDGNESSEPGTVNTSSNRRKLTYRWQRLDGTEYVFSGGSRDGHPLQSIRAASGATMTLTYLGGALDNVRDSQGRTLRFIYTRPIAAGSARHRMLTITAIDTPVGRFAYKHDELGRLQTVSRPNGLVHRYHYEAERQGKDTNVYALTGVSVESLQQSELKTERLATYTYDAQGRAVRTQNVRGDDLALAYGPKAATTITTADGARTIYRHALVAGQWKTVEATGPGCVTCPPSNVRYRYRVEGRLAGLLEATLSVDPQAKSLQQERVSYDTWGRPTLVERIGYVNGKAQKPRLILRAEYETMLQNPQSAELTPAQYATLWLPRMVARPSSIAGYERSVAMTYNDRLQPLTITESGLSPIDAEGRFVPTALSRTTSYTYSQIAGASRLTAVDGPLPGNSDTTTLHYDEAGRLRLVRQPTDLQQRFAYDEAGRIVWHQPADSVPVRTTFDDSGEPNTWQRGDAKVSIERDAFGRPLRIEMPDGEVRWIGHDGPGGLGAVISNRGWGRWQVPTLQAAQHLAKFLAIDTRTKVPARREPALTWGAVQAQHDDFGRLVALRTEATGLEIRSYDESDRLIERRFADGGVWRYERDAAGRVNAHTVAAPDAETVTTRVQWFGAYAIRVEHPNETERRRFDAAGRLMERSIERASGARFTERFGHDAADRLTTHELPEGGTLHYAWGIGSQLRGIDYRSLLGQTQPLIEPLAAARVMTASVQAPAAIQSPAGGYRYGNGIEARWQLNTAGQLAALEHRITEPPNRSQASWWSALLAWIPVARANNEAAPIAGWSYDYDAFGRMARRADSATSVVNSFGYDGFGRLVVSDRSSSNETIQPTGVDTNSREYYAYNARGITLGRRVGDSDDDFRKLAIQRTAGGLPQQIGNRKLSYTADRRLLEVRESGRVLGQYRHNTHGERIGKQDPQRGSSDYLYVSQQLAGETLQNQPSRLARRYVYANAVPVAVIDYPNGQEFRFAGKNESDYFTRASGYAKALFDRVVGKSAHIAYLHANEIGAPVAVTDSKQRVQWRAQYRVYGEANVVAAPNSSVLTPYVLNLRLPGQYWDAETGWHDNYLRMYDPAQGQYLEPDPLGPIGLPSVTEPFSYVRHNPLTYADPLGLVLFAFDGTGNDRSSRTNVLLFALNYASQSDFDRATNVSGDTYYVEGVQTQGGAWDNAVTGGALAVQLRDRVNSQLQNLDSYIQSYVQWESQRGASSGPVNVDLDIIGFSRGAASAREFANMVVDRINSGYYRQLSGGCVTVDLRMMSLFETVLSTAVSNWSSTPFRMVIPQEVRFVAHAVAANEYRQSFPLESIEPSFAAINSGGYSPGNRIERGFVGAHADIGGGYNGTRGGDGGDLSDVALNWMVQQAQNAGVQMLALPPGLREVTNPILHNEQRTPLWTFLGERSTDREIRVRGVDRNDASSVAWSAGRSVTFTGGMSDPVSQQFIEPRNSGFFSNQVGDVRMCEYAQWLNSNYGMDMRC